ncbi:UDP-GlcNAc:betaGal beta-1,3-N-acetylglucosaminyltransferase 6, partial [Ophiophagus hannah]
MGSEALSSLAGLMSPSLLQTPSQPLLLPMTAMPPCWKSSLCRLTQLLARLLCSLATLLADDDIFLNLPALERHLEQLAGPPAAYLGYAYSHVAPIHNPYSQHYMPTSLYPEPVFLPYCSSSTYILSATSAATVLGAARLLPLLPVEDMFVALCTHHAGIARATWTIWPGLPTTCLMPAVYWEVLLSVHKVEPGNAVHVGGS